MDEYSVHVCHCGPEEEEEEEANAIVSKLCPFENCVKTDLEEQDLDRHLRVGHGCQSKAEVDKLKKVWSILLPFLNSLAKVVKLEQI